jgi:T-complex protein 1 subunit alpha
MSQIFGQQRGSGGLFLGGSKVSDQDIRDQMGSTPALIANSNFFSVLATQSIANVVKSSLGPVGLDKMLVDDIGVCNHLFCKSERVGRDGNKRRGNHPFSA